MVTVYLRHKPLSGIRGLLIVLSIVVLAMIISILGNALSGGAPYGTYIIFGALIALAFMVMNRYTNEFRYRLNEERLVIEQLNGERARLLLSIEWEDVLFFGDASSAPDAGKVLRFTLREFVDREKVLVIKRDDQLTAIHVQPDDIMKARLYELLGERAR